MLGFVKEMSKVPVQIIGFFTGMTKVEKIQAWRFGLVIRMGYSQQTSCRNIFMLGQAFSETSRHYVKTDLDGNTGFSNALVEEHELYG